MLFIEEQFGVQTHIIPVDFNDGPAVYQRIRAEIEGKEIGILSKFSRSTPNFLEYSPDLELNQGQLTHPN